MAAKTPEQINALKEAYAKFGNKFVEYHEINSKGRDIYIGDLHGSYFKLMHLLDSLKFDPSTDRVFSVGDLVDRGRENLECLRLLKEDWFHCVVGNHEQMFLSYISNSFDAYDRCFVMNGGGWLSDFNMDVCAMDEIIELACLLGDRPRMMRIGNVHPTHVIHAELYSNNIEFDDSSFDLENVDKNASAFLIQSMDGDFSFWGRRLFYSRPEEQKKIAKKYERLTRVISGHTIVKEPTVINGNMINIDTGAYRGSSNLTAFVLPENKFYQANGFDFFGEVSPILI